MNTLQRAERILVDANTRLIDLALEIAAGKWIGREQEVGRCMADTCQELRKATVLMFASDGTDGPVPSIDLH